MQYPSSVSVALYIRVSTQEQKTEGYGLEAQEEHLRSYVQTHMGNNDVIIYADTHTGAKMKTRPKLQKLFRDIKQKKVQKVIVWKIDRLSRSLKDLTDIMEFFCSHDVNFTSVQENMNFSGVMGQFVFNLFGSIAELERGIIKSRTMSGIEASARSGNYTYKWAPYGYRKVKNSHGKGSVLQINKRQARWVKKIFVWSAYEDLSDRKIATKLNAMKLFYDAESVTQSRKSSQQPPRRWTHRIIEKMIRNTIYAGEFTAVKRDEQGKDLPKDKRVIVPTPAIIDPVLWELAQQKRTQRKKFRGNPLCMLPQKIIDVTTPQQKIFSGIRRTKGGFSYRRNKCTHEGIIYPPFEVPAHKVDLHVWQQVLTAIENPEAFAKKYLQSRKDETQDIKDLANELNKEIASIENEQIPRIQQAFETGAYDIEMMKTRLEAKQEDLQRKKAELTQHESHLQSTGKIDVSTLQRLSQKLKQRIHNFSGKEKQTLCGLVVSRVELTRNADHYRERKQVSGKIYLEFSNLNHSESLSVSRTQLALPEKKKGLIDRNCNLHGGEGRIPSNSSTAFEISFKL